jgi:hypothetical protein
VSIIFLAILLLVLIGFAVEKFIRSGSACFVIEIVLMACKFIISLVHFFIGRRIPSVMNQYTNIQNVITIVMLYETLVLMYPGRDHIDCIIAFMSLVSS